MNYSVGALVRAREREWVVLPGSDDNLLILRPLGGTDDEITGILTGLEEVKPARFDLPDPSELGDYRSCRFLRDALRIGFRSSAGPFRSFGKIAVEPRPYQIVPLLMALKLDPIRLLIADDVGIGKTIEACLIARELLDRGEIERLAVLCPPQLAEQWQRELDEKFHIQAELVLTNTVGRLEKNCRMGESLFEHYPFVVVSMDFIKSDRRRDEFLRTCPEFVIVDEAHTCASPYGSRSRHQRHQLVAGIAQNPDRHLLLITATPHSGKEETFRSLLGLLKEEFGNLPLDLSGEENKRYREELAKHFIQRQRGNIKKYLGEETIFPVRDPVEEDYQLSESYKRFLNKVLAYARETVADESGSTFHQRVRWWSVLALLRSLASSPAAAAETLRNRSASADTETVDEADEMGRRTVLDLMDGETVEGIDLTPGSDIGEWAEDEERNRQRLLRLAREAESLKGKEDHKLQKAIQIIENTINKGYNPIIFCRFISTVHYVAEALRKRLDKNVEIADITGDIPPAEREIRVKQLEKSKTRVLVCTDALSEGINLQEYFNAAMHYDLSWNPTRHEQREGRVDRFGQSSKMVRTITYYGTDNVIDGVVLDVLIRKHKNIVKRLGISIPIPANADQVIEAIFESLLLRKKETGDRQLFLPGFEETIKPQKERLAKKYDELFNREKKNRSLFAQERIKVDVILRELEANRTAIGSKMDVASFTKDALRAFGASIRENDLITIDLTETPQGLRDMLGFHTKIQAQFDLPVKEDVIYLNRTHPIVENLAAYVLDTALDPIEKSIARRCGVIRTNEVTKRTTLLLVRFRYHIITEKGERENPTLAEDAGLLVFEGAARNANWINDFDGEKLLKAKPKANILADQAKHFLDDIIGNFNQIGPHLDEVARTRGEALLQAHQRVRTAAKIRGIHYRIEPVLPPDILGIYVYLPDYD